MRYEGMIYRPPSEAYSLIVQVTIGCSQNRCIFCSMFKEKRFRIRKVEEVLEDLQDARNKYRYVEKIFLADGDALICKMTDLEAILHFIKDQFPECKQVTLYGSPRSILMKQQEDLDKLRELGISMIYMGLESGNDEVLTYMKKRCNITRDDRGSTESKTGKDPFICDSYIRVRWKTAMEGTCKRYRTCFIPDEARLYRIAYINDRRRSSVSR